jgi:hypothetical protein
MQTFLPYADFRKTVKCLDYRRLGKQRVEAYQILKILNGETNRWVNHPAVLMWRGYENALGLYMNHCILEWVNRGYNNNMRYSKIVASDIVLPSWFGDENFHASHRSNLLRKNFEYYSQFGWNETPELEYIWPVRKLNESLS